MQRQLAPLAFASALRREGGAAAASILGCLLLLATPLGDMLAVSSRSHLHLLEFVDRKALPAELKRLQAATGQALGIGRLGPSEQAGHELSAYFAGLQSAFATPLALSGSPFTRQVWHELRKIPPGQTRSYSQIAHAIGRPTAVRAVANANGANQIALMIPCHRVIGADGSLTGYGGGLWRKQKLIEIEKRLQTATGGIDP